MSALRAVFLDFDGVVLESLDVKARAFVELYGDHPQHHEAIVRHHLENGGVSRFDKFRWIAAELLGAPLDEADAQELGRRFGEIVRAQLLSCPFVAGAPEFLREAAGRYPLFVASGTPEGELREIVEARGLAGFFAGVHGTPRRKGEILRAVLAERGVAPGEAVFVGDALADLEGAREAGVAFVGRVPAGEASMFPPGAAVLEVRDLRELAERWDELLAAVGR